MSSLYGFPSELLDLSPPKSAENMLDGAIDRELEVSDLGGIDGTSRNCVDPREISMLGAVNCGF